MNDDILDKIAEKTFEESKSMGITNGMYDDFSLSKPLGIPDYVDKIIRESGYEGYILAIEVGGRGVLHPELGLIEMRTLKRLALENKRNES